MMSTTLPRWNGTDHLDRAGGRRHQERRVRSEGAVSWASLGASRLLQVALTGTLSSGSLRALRRSMHAHGGNGAMADSSLGDKVSLGDAETSRHPITWSRRSRGRRLICAASALA